MGVWLSAMKALPWATILKQAPTVLAAADALLAGSRRRAAAPAGADAGALRQRIAEMEEHQKAAAALVKQLADQVNALALAAEASATHARRAMTAAGVASLLAVLAVLVAWLR